MGEIFTGKVYVLVTGASRGIGKHISEVFGSRLGNKSHVLLLARNVEKLKSTADALPENVIKSHCSVDFSDTSAEQLQELVLSSLKGEKPESFNRAIIVHNAAAATFTQLTTEMTDFKEWHRCFNLNTFSPAVLNGVFMNTFNNQSIKKYVINICSYWGLKPDEYTGSYCSAKAAKDMFFKVFTKEFPEVNVLNYLPGYVKTDMFHDTLEHTKNEKLRTGIQETIKNKQFVTPRETAENLAKVLIEQNYTSGDFVDFFKNQQH